MKILITGHNGYVGLNLINYFNQKHSNIELWGIARNTHSDIPNVKTINMDLCNPKLNETIKKISPEIIVHLASRRFGTLEELFTDNVKATENLLNSTLHIQSPKPKIIISGSSAEIGIQKTKKGATEKIDCTPIDNYGITKLMQSKLALSYSIKYDLDIVRLRFFNIIGLGLPDTLLAGNAVKQFKLQIETKNHVPIAFGDLSSFRDYLDIKDICTAIDLAISKGQKGELYHIASGVKTSGKQLIELVKQQHYLQTKQLINYTSNQKEPTIVKFQRANICKAQRELDWSPKVNISSTIQNMWQHYSNNEK